MFLLNELQECNQIRSSKVVNCFQSCEHGLVGNTLKVIFTNVLCRTNENK